MKRSVIVGDPPNPPVNNQRQNSAKGFKGLNKILRESLVSLFSHVGAYPRLSTTLFSFLNSAELGRTDCSESCPGDVCQIRIN